MIIVLDQFRAEYLTRFRDRFSAGGFQRLLDGGAVYDGCTCPYVPTDTGPGHAALATGTTPARSGIVGNEWYDEDLHRMVGAVEDSDAPLVGAAKTQPGASPRHLAGDTFADEVRLATGGRGRTFAVSGKDRASVLLAGKSATGAYWYDPESGRMVTSRYYADALRPWVAAFNGERPADRWIGKPWVVGGKTKIPLGEPGSTPGRAYYDALLETPHIHEMLFEFARRLVREERLGADSDTDVLSIGLSGHDYLGHRLGPYDDAAAEMAEDTDRRLGIFLRELDGVVGQGEWWVVLAADHGVAPTLEQSAAIGLRPEAFDHQEARARIARALAGLYPGAPEIRLHGTPVRIWIDRRDLLAHHASPGTAARAAGEALDGVPGLLGWAAGDDTGLDAATAAALRLGDYPSRSPDLFLIPKPFSLAKDVIPADHGTPWNYDAEIPIVLYGPPFRPGRHHDRCSNIDLAPTLSAGLGIPPPAMATGQPLPDAFR